jgi:type II secretory pathway component PulF
MVLVEPNDMPLFSYKAKNERGEFVTANVEAASHDEAKRILEQQGLQSVEIATPGSTPEVHRATRLNGPASTEVINYIAELTANELPLAEGLRAAAAESTRPSATRVLLQLADEIDRGVTLPDAVSEAAYGFPSFMRGLVIAAARTRQLGITLDELIAHDRDIHRVWRTLAGSLVYPVLVLAMAVTVMVLLFVYIVPQFKEMFEEFGLVLPSVTNALIRMSDLCVMLTSGIQGWFTVTSLISIVIAIGVLRFAIGGARWQWLVSTLPIIGPLWSWSGAAGFSRLLAVLVDNEIPLPEALNLAGQGVREQNIHEACITFSQGVESGSRLSELLADSPDLPRSLVPFVEYGEEQGDLADALRVASNLFLDRLRLRAALLRSVSPPVIFIAVSLVVLLTVVSLLFPLINLIQGLS